MSDTVQRTLRDHVAGWHPAPIVETDILDPAQASRLAATLDTGETFGPDDALPIPWHWVYFSEWPPTADLGPDGHPADGHFLPPLPERRRMFAGSRITSTGPLRLGVSTEKRSSIAAITEKTGRTGDMLFVTVRSEYRQDGDDEPRLVEVQNLVYRSDSGHSRPFERPSSELGESTAQWSTEPTPTTTTLFRYSALTSNAHRIHYDRPYVTEVEGYPDLVVHGPLLATYLAELVRISRGGESLRNFEFRLQRPLFIGDRFRVEASDDDGDVALRVVTGGDAVHVSGRGSF
ncbi:hypothetical protein [Gordonia sp. NPDC003950]